MIKILITGAKGFIGSYLCNELSRHKKFKVIGLYSTDNKQRNDLLKNTILKKCKVNSKNFLNILENFNPDTIIHCSWFGVENKFKNNKSQNKNLYIIKKIIKNREKNPKRHYIFFGSQIEYRRTKKKISEKSKLFGTTKYAREKIICLNYLRANKVNFTWLRLFDVYGNLDKKSWIIPKMINSFKSKKRYIINNPNAIWDFLYIKDLVKIVKKVILKKCNGEFNLCSGYSYKIKDVMKMIDIKGNFLKTKNLKTRSNFDLKCNNTKLTRILKHKIKNNIKNNIQKLLKNGYFI